MKPEGGRSRRACRYFSPFILVGHGIWIACFSFRRVRVARITKMIISGRVKMRRG